MSVAADEAQQAFLKLSLKDVIKSSHFMNSLTEFINHNDGVGRQQSKAVLEFKQLMSDYKEARKLLAECNIPNISDEMLLHDSLKDKIDVLLEYVNEDDDIQEVQYE